MGAEEYCLSLRRGVPEDDLTFLEMNAYRGGGTFQPPCNPEFAKAVPTNGFGEVEATVTASLDHPSAPRPRSIPTKSAKKSCRIYSPVSTPRAGYSDVGGMEGIGSLKAIYQQRDAPSRPHTADAALVHRSKNMETAAAAHRGSVSGVLAVPCTHAEASDSARLMVVHPRSRPMTSDGSSQWQKLQRHGVGTRRIDGTSIDRHALGGQWRPSTSGEGRRRPPAVSHGGFESGRVLSSASSKAPPATNCRIEDTSGLLREQQKQQKQQQKPHGKEALPQEGNQQRQQNFASVPNTNNAASFDLR